MATYTKRVQTMLTDDQFATLERLSRETSEPISLLIRAAIEKVYFEQERRARREAALASLLSLNAPVSDWPEMEQEIIEGARE